ncbi:hypothetical protein CI238_09514 [Colletotrichum incanum]|uniref:Uncharacterized protein n=1 Tax=Colletotrichum incanum TaxID=1573173 RepID=A0A166R9J5_COLIC|nr:hypothetical protein CI238_09514 [Colletotrichum incanum]
MTMTTFGAATSRSLRPSPTTILSRNAALSFESSILTGQHFNQWVSERDILAPDDTFWSPAVAQLPRFRFFLYINKQCLNTVIQFQDADNSNCFTRALLPPMIVTVIDASWTLDSVQDYMPQNKGGCSEVDGSDRNCVRRASWQRAG